MWILVLAGIAIAIYEVSKHKDIPPAPSPPPTPTLPAPPSTPIPPNPVVPTPIQPVVHSELALTLSPREIQTLGMKIMMFTEDGPSELAIRLFRDQETRANQEAIRDEARRLGGDEKVLQKTFEMARGL